MFRENRYPKESHYYPSIFKYISAFDIMNVFVRLIINIWDASVISYSR